jgi:FkbM family methyltransferase
MRISKTPQNMVVVDVGSASGEFTKHVLKSQKKVMVFMIEPNIALNDDSLSKIEILSNNRSKKLMFALGKSNGTANLYGSRTFNGQLGSLNKFNAKKSFDEALSGKIDYSELLTGVEVKTRTVLSFLQENSLKKIDFLKIDTQGTDLDLLEEFLNLTDVRSFVVEVTGSVIPEKNTYLGRDNSMQRLYRIAESFNLKTLKVIPATTDTEEFNVFMAKNLKEGQANMEKFNISKSVTFGRHWRVLGIGETIGDNDQRNRKFFIKSIQALKHPRSSISSVIRKLTS